MKVIDLNEKKQTAIVKLDKYDVMHLADFLMQIDVDFNAGRITPTEVILNESSFEYVLGKIYGMIQDIERKLGLE